MHALQLHYLGNALNQAPEALVVKSVSFGKRPPSDAFSQLQEPARQEPKSVIVTNNRSRSQPHTCSPQTTRTCILCRLLILCRSSFTRTGSCRSSAYVVHIVSRLFSLAMTSMMRRRRRKSIRNEMGYTYDKSISPPLLRSPLPPTRMSSSTLVSRRRSTLPGRHRRMLRRMNCDRSRLMGVSCCLLGVFAFAFEFD